jgi:acetylornithine deacetylase/succinyl-diaminopimelate desuccinylase-like protein
VNCRMLPGSDPTQVQRTLEKVLADPKIKVAPVREPVPSDPSPLRPDLMEPLERITREMWNVPAVPVMLTGATDGLYLRNAGIPTYGVSGLFEDIDDIRAHGRDERIGVKQFAESRQFLDRLVRSLSAGK